MALGVGLSSRASASDVRQAAVRALAEAGRTLEDVDVVATRRTFADDPRIVELGRAVAAFEDKRLSAADVTTPPAALVAQRGLPAVAEAAALLGAGPGARLLVPKRVGNHVTVAVAGSPGA